MKPCTVALKSLASTSMTSLHLAPTPLHSTLTASLLRAQYVLLFPIPHSVMLDCYLEFFHGGLFTLNNQQSLETNPFGEQAYQHNTVWPSANYSTIMQLLYLPPFPHLLLVFIPPKPFPTWLANYSPLTFCLHFGPTPNLVISLLQSTFHPSSESLFFLFCFSLKVKNKMSWSMKFDVKTSQYPLCFLTNVSTEFIKKLPYINSSVVLHPQEMRSAHHDI